MNGLSQTKRSMQAAAVTAAMWPAVGKTVTLATLAGKRAHPQPAAFTPSRTAATHLQALRVWLAAGTNPTHNMTNACSRPKGARPHTRKP
jgi:hypothetical protein